MYTYLFELTPARRGNRFVPSDYIEELKAAEENINNGLAFRRDGKKIKIESVDDEKIMLTLTCKTALVHASRSLSALTRYLTTYYRDTFEEYVYNKTLFAITLISQKSSFESSKEVLSNEEILKGVIDLLYSYTTTTLTEANERKKVIETISDLVKPYRITQ